MSDFHDGPEDSKKKKLADRKARRWFPGNRNPYLKYLEILGRSVALTIRVIMRVGVGVSTFNLTMIFVGFIWLRIFVFISVPASEVPWRLINPFVFDSVESAILSIYSYIFLFICIGIFVHTERLGLTGDKDDEMDVKNPGESSLLGHLIDEEKLFSKKTIIQAGLEPLFVFSVGWLLVIFGPTKTIGLYLFFSSFFYFYDEWNYHRSNVLDERIKKSDLKRGKKKIKKLKNKKK